MARKSMLELTVGRSIAGTIGGIAAVVLAILGLVGLFPIFLAAITTIVVGATFLLKGLAISQEYTNLLSHPEVGGGEKLEFGGGITAELIAGAAGIVLGILALLGINNILLPAIAVIAFGAGLVVGGGVLARLNSLKLTTLGVSERAQIIAKEAVATAVDIQMLVGLAAIVLGILALLGFSPTVLTLIALLAIGGATLLSGSAVTGKVMSLLHR